MNDPHELTVRLKNVDGTWETCGADRLRGVIPENLQATADRWGSTTVSFILRRRPGSIHPDLAAFTPCEVEIGGILCWSGRVKETPERDSADASISVSGEGWQYHLDDDVYERRYIHTSFSDYVDLRSLTTTPLAGHVQAFQVQSDGGIVLSWPNGGTVGANTRVGVVLDLGVNSGAVELHAVVRSSFNSSAAALFIIGSDVPYWGATGANRQDYVSGATNNGGNWAAANDSHLFSATSSLPHRYITLLLNTGVGGTPSADIWFAFDYVGVATDGTYMAAGASTLKAGAVIEDALLQATTLLNPINSDTVNNLISAGTFNMPEFGLGSPQSPREVINAVNAYENFETKVDVDKRVIFRARATVPKYEIGEWSGAAFEDASANSGEEIYNRVIVTSTGPDQLPLQVIRYQAHAETLPFKYVSPQQFTNGNFNVNTSGWTAAEGTIVRTTTNPYEGSGSGLLRAGSLTIAEAHTSTVPLKIGKPYEIVFAFRQIYAGANGFTVLRESLPDAGTGTIGSFSIEIDTGTLTVGTWFLFSTLWEPNGTPAEDRVWVRGNGFDAPLNTDIGAFEIVEVREARPSLVDRQGFNRTKILPLQHAITEFAAQRIGDLYLQQHLHTPFRGSFQATGSGGIRRVSGGGNVHPAELLRETGQLVRCSHRVDPDNGAWSRDGTIAAVSYDHNSLTSSVSLDDERSGFETLLERLAVVIGQSNR